MTWNDTEVNPFDPNTPDLQPETQPLDVILKQAIAAAIMALRVHLPAKIVKVSGNQKVDVQPLLQTRYIDGQVVNLPIIQNVMVQMPVGANWSIKLPIAVGDTGSLLFCDRSLDTWAASGGGIVDPQDSRTHDYSDPVFIPGLVPFANQTTDTTSDLVLTNGKSQIRLEAGGGFKIQNKASNQELITILLKLTDTLINNTYTNTLLGPQQFIASTILLLQQIQVNLQTLQG